MKKTITIFIFALVILVSTVTAFSLDWLFPDKFDSTLTKIYTSTICDKESSMLKFERYCDAKTPSEINVSFDLDSDEGQIKVDYAGVERSS